MNQSGEPIGWKPSHCAFCGNEPKKKTKEHFIPRWMSKSSEADDIPAYIETPTGMKRIKLSGVTIPACEACNHASSKLEASAKEAFLKIRDGTVAGTDCIDLLDWMDKFRVSKWLYMLSVKKEQHAISPRFSVNSRIGKSDRLLSISLLPDNYSSGIGIAGVAGVLFLINPTVIGLLFRDVAIISWSEVSLLGDLFGYSKTIGTKNDGNHPQLQKTIGHAVSIPDKLDISRLPNLEFFSFSKETELFHSEILVDRPSVLDGKGNIREIFEKEVLPVPRSKSSKEFAKKLWLLSVLETQKRSSQAFRYIQADDKNKVSQTLAINQVDRMIDDLVAEINAESLFKYRRRV